jgi:hypothetical protein
MKRCREKSVKTTPFNAGATRKRCEWCRRVIEVVEVKPGEFWLSAYGYPLDAERKLVLNPNGSLHECSF